MNTGSPTGQGADNNLAGLVRQLAETEAALQALLAGQVDAIVDEDGQTFLLHAAQQRLLASENAQRHQAELQTEILDALPSHIALVDREGVITTVNAAWRGFAKYNGLTGSTFGVGQNYLHVCDLVQGDDAIGAHAVGLGLRRVLDGEVRNFSSEYSCHAPSEPRWFLLSITPLCEGRRAGAVIAHTNITARKLAHQALQASEERFRLLSKATNDAIWDWDLDCGHVWWNEGFEILFGYSRSEVEPTIDSWTKRIHPDDHQLVVDSIHQAIDHGADLWSDEYRFLRKDGSYAYVSDRGYIIRQPDGKAVRMIGGMTDLTLRKQTEERIAEQAALLDVARDAISVRDLEHRASYWNKSAERLYGWSSIETSGQSVRTLLYPDPTAFDLAMHKVQEHGEWAGELSPTSKDGRHLLIEARWTLMRDKAGAPRSIFSICTDITERRLLEQQFLRAQRLESIGTLAGGIAHDLNNVLTPILLSINLLSRGEKDEKRLRILSIIDASANRGADMVKQVLSFARGVEGQRLQVRIPELLRDVEKIANDTFLKNIQVRVVIASEIWTVLGDLTQLHQVLINLCVNARDAMPDGGVLTLSAENQDLDVMYAKLHIDAKPGPYVVLQVEDTGTGIPPDILEKIFEPFFTTKDIGKGTGLGLSTSLAMIKSHGGFLRVYSEPGRGTTFKLYLPATVTPGTDSHTRKEPMLPRGHGELVLVVDDEDAVRQITRQTLEAFGYRVVLAADGSEALALFAVQQRDIAVVLTDMMMPIIEGNAVIRVMMKMCPDVRIIAASGLNENHVVAKAISSGVKHFLTKPYTAEALLTRIAEVLSPGG